jgi:predicted metal-dependent hydrolase
LPLPVAIYGKCEYQFLLKNIIFCSKFTTPILCWHILRMQDILIFMVKNVKSAQAHTQGIEIGEKSIDYMVRISPKARHARLEVSYETGLTVILPQGYPNNQVISLLINKRNWVLKKLAECKRVRLNNIANESRAITYLGCDLKIFRREGTGSVEKAVLEPEGLVLHLKPDSPSIQIIEQWLRLQAKELFTTKAQRLSVTLGVKYYKLAVRSAKTRWGSCSPSGNLSFNWKLIMAPEEVINYVVVHELCHLIELNHSKKFWHLVEQRCPQWRLHRKWLRIHQMELMVGYKV